MMLLATLLLTAQEAPHTDALVAVPEDALVVLALEDADALRARAGQSAWTELLSDPRLEPLMAEVARITDELLSEEGVEEAHRDPAAWWKALHGPVRAFLSVDADLDGTAGVFVGLGDDRAALDELVDSFWESVARDGVASSTSYQDVAIELLEDPEAGEHEPDVLALFECAGQLAVVLGDGREKVLLASHGAIDRLTGRDPAEGFAGLPALAEARAAAGHRAAVEAFVDIAGFVEVILLESEQDGDADVEADRRAHEFLGTSASRWVYAAADVGAGEALDATFAMHLGQGGFFHDLSRLVGPLPAQLLSLVPPDSLNVFLGRIDVAGFWELLQDAMEELSPDEHAQMRAGIEQLEPMLGFDVETDVIDRIRGDFLQFDVIVPLEEVPAEMVELLGGDVAEALRRGTVSRYGLDEASDVADVVESLLETAGISAQIESSEYQDHWIHSLESMLHWSFTEDALFVSESPTPLRAALSRLGSSDAPSIAGDPRFEAALGRHRSAAVLGVGDTRANLQAMLTALRSIGPLVLGFDEDLGEGEETALRLLELLPEPEVVRDHLAGVTSYAVEVGPQHVAFRVSSR